MSEKNTSQDYNYMETPDNFNPFDEPVVEREYTKPKVSYDPATISHIPEPLYEQPNLDELQEDDYDDKPKSKKETKSKPKSGFGSDDPFVNQELEEYSTKDAEEASSQLVDTFLEGYKVAHTLGARYFTMSEEEIVKKAIKGELNPDMMIPVSPTSTISVRDFIGEFNNQVNEVLVVEDEFVEKVKPVMIRVFSKRGYGMTDEQYLMFAFGKDILQKGAQLYAFKKSLTQSLKMMTEMYNAQVNPQYNSEAPTPSQQTSPPPPPPTPPQEQTPPPPPPEPPTTEIPEQFEENFTQNVEQEMEPQIEEMQTMHQEMEDEITIKPKRRRGRPKKKMRLEPTEEEGKTIVIDSPSKDVDTPDIDLNANFDMEDAKETEEK